MKTISQVIKLTGVSARTLQYYDEIDLHMKILHQNYLKLKIVIVI